VLESWKVLPDWVRALERVELAQALVEPVQELTGQVQ
jgi:hypothetical protein